MTDHSPPSHEPPPHPSTPFAWVDALHRIDLLAATFVVAAARAIDTGEPVAVVGWPLLVVPDVVLVQWQAWRDADPDGWDGPPLPPERAITRLDDEREVASFRLAHPVAVVGDEVPS